MYNQLFGLRENPFNVNPDPRYLFLTRQTAEAWDGLKHGIQARKGLLVLTGEVGTGKTTLLNHLLDWLHQQHAPTAFLFNSHLEISHLFDFVLSDFAVKFDATLKDNALLRLHQWLWERYRAGDTPVVIVDEAQGLSDRVLEEIRMLLNLETSNEKLLQIVLAGQPELEQRLQQPELRQVKQRIALRCKTSALSRDETHQYVQARLHIAGADGPRIFASDAMDAVHFYSRGIPRVMNLLCEHALINASAEHIQPVPALPNRLRRCVQPGPGNRRSVPAPRKFSARRCRCGTRRTARRIVPLIVLRTGPLDALRTRHRATLRLRLQTVLRIALHTRLCNPFRTAFSAHPRTRHRAAVRASLRITIRTRVRTELRSELRGAFRTIPHADL